MRSVVGRAADRRYLGGLQRRLDHPPDTESDLVLQIEHIFQRAVETIGPQMRAGLGVDQLPGDADPVPPLRTEPSST